MTYDIPVITCRKISTDDIEATGVTIYTGIAFADAFLKIPDEENVRRYTLDANKVRRKTGVHAAIEDTLLNSPSNFAILNGGITLVARKADLEKKGFVKLTAANIINGSQTRGVLRDYFDADITRKEAPPQVKYELIVTEDDDLITETSISRNNQIRVDQISIMGSREEFHEMDERIQNAFNGLQLQKSETDRGEKFIPTEKLLQVIAALIPDELWKYTKRTSTSKTFAYSSKAGPLKLYEKIFNERTNTKPESDGFEKLYQYYLDIAPQAWILYSKWSGGSPFAGHDVRSDKALERDDKNTPVWAADGLIFPIIASLSVFVKKVDNVWLLDIPEALTDKLLARQGVEAFRAIGKHEPMVNGKSEGAYVIVRTLTETIANLS